MDETCSGSCPILDLHITDVKLSYSFARRLVKFLYIKYKDSCSSHAFKFLQEPFWSLFLYSQHV